MGKKLNFAYRKTRVLLTGHTGFKGTWLSIWLKELGADVIGFSLKKWDNEKLFRQTKMNKNIIDKRGDINDFNALSDVVTKYSPEIIFHLAAQPLVRMSYKFPHSTFMTNVMGTVNVLECVRKFNFIKAGVMITTDKCYKNNEKKEGYVEGDALGGIDPYSSSKAAAEIAIESYRKSFFKDKLVASARAGNNIGGGDFAKDRIVPDCIAALKRNKPIKLRNPKSIRPWQHVLEPLYGYLLLGSKLLNNKKEFAESWNFGPEKKSICTVSKVADMVIKNWGSGKWMRDPDIHGPHEAKLLWLDNGKAKEKLKWVPRWAINTAIEKTVEWYKRSEKEDPYKLCINQIKEYNG